MTGAPNWSIGSKGSLGRGAHWVLQSEYRRGSWFDRKIYASWEPRFMQKRGRGITHNGGWSWQALTSKQVGNVAALRHKGTSTVCAAGGKDEERVTKHSSNINAERVWQGLKLAAH